MAIKNYTLVLHAFVASLCVVATAAIAQGSPPPSLSLSLNSVEQAEQNCRLVFVIDNKLNSDIEKFALEVVLFTLDEKVERFALFDFNGVPVDKMRVRQFELPEAQCSQLSKVLINGSAACDGGSLAGNECLDYLNLSSKTRLEVSG
ncbi:MAG: hypothetical protein AAGF25_04325 [Pseudomonadota bacterium]